MKNKIGIGFSILLLICDFKRIIGLSFYSLSFLIVFISCSISRSVSDTNYASIYDPTEMPIKPKISVVHKNDTTSIVHFQLKSNHFIYLRSDSTKEIKASYSIKYRLLTSYKSTVVIDSATYRYVDRVSTLQTHLLNNSFALKIKQGNNYLLEFKVFDDTRKIGSTSYIEINKNGSQSNQYFEISDSLHTIYYPVSLRLDEKYLLQYQNKLELNCISVKYYKNGFPAARSPFDVVEDIAVKLLPDSVFCLDNKSGYFDFVPKAEGVYYIQADTSVREGSALKVFNRDYPLQNTVDLLVEPLVYITTQTEYDGIQKNTNKKAGVDQFWIDAAGNPDRAKELISNYYSRVQDANVLFASYLEGWKTDRGMIYIVFGPPNMVYKTESSEVWVYGEARNINSITFKFQKMENPFTNNDFMLSRSQLYKSTWYNAAEMWRR